MLLFYLFSCSGFYRFRLFVFRVLQIPAFHVPGFTDSGFSCSGFYRFRLFMFRVLQIPAFRVPGFTDSGFSCSGFYRFRLFVFRVLPIPAFHVPGFTDSGFSCSGFYRFRLFVFRVLQIPAFHVPGFLVPCSIPRSVPRFPVPCFTDSRRELAPHKRYNVCTRLGVFMLVWSHTGFLQTGIYSSKFCHSIIQLSFSPVSIHISVLICSYFYLLATDPFGK